MLVRPRYWIRRWYLWFLISGITFVALLCIFSLLLIPSLKCGDQNCTAYSRCGRTRDLYNMRISSLFLYLKLLEWTSVLCCSFCSFSLFVFATWGLWGWWFLDPAVDLFSATVDWKCYSCLAFCCVRCASQKIYQHLNFFATCFPTQQVYWYLPVVPLCHPGF